MPIYEFACLGCRHRFEVFGAYTSRSEIQVCPQCEGTNTKALFSSFAKLGGAQEASSSEAPSGCACGGACSCSN